MPGFVRRIGNWPSTLLSCLLLLLCACQLSCSSSGTPPKVIGAQLTLGKDELLTKLGDATDYRAFDGKYPTEWPLFLMMLEGSYLAKDGSIHSANPADYPAVHFQKIYQTMAVEKVPYLEQRARIEAILGQSMESSSDGADDQYRHYQGRFTDNGHEFLFVIRVWRLKSSRWSATGYFLGIK